MNEHSHCPHECEHPQPFRAALLPERAAEYPHVTPCVEQEFCGRCWHVCGELTVMVPCTPEVCHNEPGKSDVCEICHGTKGGVPGNENIVNGVVMCDYCHADLPGEPKENA